MPTNWPVWLPRRTILASESGSWNGPERSEGWRPSTLFLTHFGAVTDVAEHLRRFRNALDASARRVKATLAGDGSDEDRIARFVQELRAEVRREMTEDDARSFEVAAPFEQLWLGLARYWRKKT